jgi:hypothetical protein
VRAAGERPTHVSPSLYLPLRALTAWCILRPLAPPAPARSADFLYFLATALQPRFLATVTEAGEPCPVEVRVGQAVETVGQAGKPKSITGFQTHTTPVLVSARDRAELADEAFVALSNVAEGIVVLRVNAEVKAKRDAEKAARAAEASGVRGVRVGARADLTWG